tara:strand:+ start:9291 stop:9692 length:402 start_codon:yes stop_codon:yes gene_type:complete
MNKELRFSADLNNLDRVEKFVNSILDLVEVDERLYGNIIVAVIEAVTNAVVHGNKGDVQKEVKVQCNTSDTLIEFRVKDEGNGFDFTNIPDPTLPGNVEKIDGRGVFLITSLADQIEFHENGTLLEMQFNLAV